MLAKTADPFDSKGHYFEPKWDGLRCIAYIHDGKADLQNRNLRLVTNSYPELRNITNNVDSKAAVIDGEIVVLRKNGLPDFESLSNRFGVEDAIRVRILASKFPSTYIAFDLLHLDGKDIVNQPLSSRRVKLGKIVRDGPHILLSQFVPEKGKSFFRKAVQLGLEGIIAKKIDSRYQIGIRSDDWLKIKKVRALDCVIAGYTRGDGSRSSTFGALVLAAYDRRKRLIHLGNVGTGFTDANLKRIMNILKPFKTGDRTISGEVWAPSPITWVRPRLVAEVGYTTLTRDEKLRFPRFIKLRLDGNPSDCTI
jgi:bifunctional non-homologous end joining protein LigD